MVSVFPDAIISYHHIIFAFHPAQKLNICDSVSGRAVNTIDQNNFSGWMLGNKEERNTYTNVIV